MPEFDLVARGGTVVDGQGNAPVRADVAVRDGLIVVDGNLAQLAAHVQRQEGR